MCLTPVHVINEQITQIDCSYGACCRQLMINVTLKKKVKACQPLQITI
jgi:hypothetical protein